MNDDMNHKFEKSLYFTVSFQKSVHGHDEYTNQCSYINF